MASSEPADIGAPVRIAGLDLLRAGAIGLVILTHGAQIVAPLLPARIYPWTQVGFFGVDLFFALSGFLVGSILWRTGDRLGDPRIAAGVWLNRALRTLPAYYLILTLNLVVGLGIYQSPFSSWHAVVPYLYFGQNLTHRPYWFFVESWSLCVEEWFYLLFPACLFLGLRLGGRFQRVFWSATVLMIAVPFALRLVQAPPENLDFDVNMVVIYKLDAIGWGIAAAGIAQTWPASWGRWRKWALVLGLGLVLECYIFTARMNLNASFFARTLLLLIIPGSFALLLPWASACASLGWGWFGRLTAAVARWSYALYLTNFMLSILIQVLHPGPSRLSPVVNLVLYLVASFTVSAALYHWFEAPILRRRRSLALCRQATLAQHHATP